MNKLKYLVFTIYILASSLILLFPPFRYIYASGAYKNAGYGFLFSPPQLNSINASVDVPMLLCEFIIITTLYFFGLRISSKQN
tara:strand:+ start:3014 stop:3262 length:249 start_codon:yes stop_codon:yes gene_type:complete